MTKGVDSAGNHTFVMNMEGTVTGGWDGTVLLTMIATTPDIKNGTYTSSAAVYLEDGSIITGNGGGVFAALGGHKWQTNGVDLLSDGSRIAVEGEIDLANRSYNGKIYEVA
jgi:hypothetical protein